MERRIAARVVAGMAALVVAAVGGAAFACTNLASLNVSSRVAKPGDAIVVTGSGFSGGVEAPMDGMDMAAMDMSGMAMDSSTMAVRSPVTVRWNGPDGEILTSAIPDRTGSISATITVPAAQPGHYTLVAVQKNVQGYDVYGTPARASLQITADGRTGDDTAGAGVAGSGDDSSSGIGLLALTVGLGVLGLGLVLAGGLAAARAGARRRVPVAAGGPRAA